MSLADVDAVLTAPKRLAIMGILRRVEEVDFIFIRDQLDFSDSDLSKQMAALGEAGYVASRKTGRGRTRSTWFEITPTGESAIVAHIAVLNELAAEDIQQ